jgi:hypothetical protein
VQKVGKPTPGALAQELSQPEEQEENTTDEPEATADVAKPMLTKEEQNDLAKKLFSEGKKRSEIVSLTGLTLYAVNKLLNE